MMNDYSKAPHGEVRGAPSTLSTPVKATNIAQMHNGDAACFVADHNIKGRDRPIYAGRMYSQSKSDHAAQHTEHRACENRAFSQSVHSNSEFIWINTCIK
jgi:hypothetical protein